MINGRHTLISSSERSCQRQCGLILMLVCQPGRQIGGTGRRLCEQFYLLMALLLLLFADGTGAVQPAWSAATSTSARKRNARYRLRDSDVQLSQQFDVVFLLPE